MKKFHREIAESLPILKMTFYYYCFHKNEQDEEEEEKKREENLPSCNQNRFRYKSSKTELKKKILN